MRLWQAAFTLGDVRQQAVRQVLPKSVQMYQGDDHQCRDRRGEQHSDDPIKFQTRKQDKQHQYSVKPQGGANQLWIQHFGTALVNDYEEHKHKDCRNDGAEMRRPDQCGDDSRDSANIGSEDRNERSYDYNQANNKP